MRINVKFCGFTRKSDVSLAVSLGIQKAGFIFAPKSERNLEINSNTSSWIKELKRDYPKIDFVAVIAGLDPEDTLILVSWQVFDVFQFVGSFEYLEKILPAIIHKTQMAKAPPAKIWISLGIAGLDEFIKKLSFFRENKVSGIIMDALDDNYYGGTGKSIESSPGIFEKLLKLKGLSWIRNLYLAGGLKPGHVREKIQGWLKVGSHYLQDSTLQLDDIFPFDGVDLASGIERGNTGGKPVKDEMLMKKFMDEIRDIRGSDFFSGVK